MYIGFSLVERWGSPLPPAKNLLIPPLLPTKSLFSPHKKSIQSYKKIKTSFLAVVIAPVPILF